MLITRLDIGASVTLYQGDCKEALTLLAKETVASIITDPPYGTNYRSNGRKDKFDHMINDKGVPTDWLAEAKRVSKFRTTVYWFTDEDGITIAREALVSAGYGLRTMLVWDKQTMAMGNLEDYGSQTEFIVFGTNGPVKLEGGRSPNLISVPRVHPQNRVHPTEKPLALMEYLILKSTKVGDLVVDPFFGSGVVGEACIRTGRRFWGSEIDPQYFKLAVARLSKAYEEEKP